MGLLAVIFGFCLVGKCLTFRFDREIQTEYPTFMTSEMEISSKNVYSNEYKFPMPKITILNSELYMVAWTVAKDSNVLNAKFEENDVYGRICYVNGTKLTEKEFIINKLTNYSQDTVDITVLYDNNNNVLPLIGVTWESFNPLTSDDIYLNIFYYEFDSNNNIILNQRYDTEMLVNLQQFSVQSNPQIISLFNCNCFIIIWTTWDGTNAHNKLYDIAGRSFFNNGQPITPQEYYVHEPTSKLEHNQRGTPLKLSIDTERGFWLVTYTVYDGAISGLSGIYASILDEMGDRYVEEFVVDGGVDVYKLDETKGDFHVEGEYYHDYSDCTYLINDYFMVVYITKKENKKWLKTPKLIGNIFKINIMSGNIDRINLTSNVFNSINMDNIEPFYPRIKVLRCYYYGNNYDINKTMNDNACDISVCWYSEGKQFENTLDYNVYCEFYNILFNNVTSNDIKITRYNDNSNGHLMVNNEVQNARYPDIDSWDRINNSNINNNATNSGSMVITWLIGNGYGIYTRMLNFNITQPNIPNINDIILFNEPDKHNKSMIIILVAVFLTVLICFLLFYKFRKHGIGKVLFTEEDSNGDKIPKKKKRFTFKNNKLAKHEQIDINDTDYDTETINGSNLHINDTVSRKSKTHERRSSVAVTKSHDAKGRNVYQLQPNDANENELSTDDDIDDDRDDPLDHIGITPLRNKGNNNESSNNLLINVDRDVTPASNLSHLSDN